jgi:choline dehydrogenase-like flavoprotein
VILLESGGFAGDAATQSLYEGETGGAMAQREEYTRSSRLRFFGGTTNHWNGWCRPLDPLDFRKRDWVPLSGWPIEGRELREAYRQACALCEIQPFEPDPPPIAESDRPLISIDPRAAAIETKPFFYSKPTRFGMRYRDDIVDARSVKLMIHANAVRLDVEAGGRRIAAVQVAADPGRRFRVRARQYVLATGGLENPRLLLDSDDFFPNGIGNQHDFVGRTFMEHPRVGMGQVLLWRGEHAASLYTSGSESKRRGHRVRAVLSTRESFQVENRTLNFGAVFAGKKVEEFDRGMNEGIEAGSRGLDRKLEKLARLDSSDRKVNRWPRSPTLARVIAHGEQSPNPDSRVTLTSERDPFGMRRLRLDWRLSELDRRSLYQSTREVARGLLASFRGRVRLYVRPDERNSFKIHYQNHHMGTTRMSEDPRHGVVDPDCRVHGLDNLYVAGSSVFPVSGFANPTLTLVALAWRLSETLKQRLG